MRYQWLGNIGILQIYGGLQNSPWLLAKRARSARSLTRSLARSRIMLTCLLWVAHRHPICYNEDTFIRHRRRRRRECDVCARERERERASERKGAPHTRSDSTQGVFQPRGEI